MAKSIIVTGRGGTGKTTFAALAGRFLPGPKLLVDADPDQCMAQMLGVNLPQHGIRTVSEALYEVQDGTVDRQIQSMPLAQKVEYLLNVSCLYEGDDFDLLTLGVKWTRGCYCAANSTLQTLLEAVVDNYRVAVFDSPAGLEHINRRVVTEADDVFAIADPSAKSLRNVEAVRDMADQVGFRFGRLWIVANHRVTDRQEGRLREIEGTTYLGRIADDPAVQQADWEGRSLLDLPEDSPACASVRALLEAAGCEPARPQPAAD